MKKNKNAKDFVNNAMFASDLLQSYVDKAVDEIEKLSKFERAEVMCLLNRKEPTNVEEAGAKAILVELLSHRL